MEKIVITGMGTINSLGLSVEESWQAAVNGVSGVGPITQFDTGEYLVKIACEARNFVPENYMEQKEARRRDRYEQMAVAAVKEAMMQSGLTVTESNAGRIGVVISAAIGGLKSLADGFEAHVSVEMAVQVNEGQVGGDHVPILPRSTSL